MCIQEIKNNQKQTKTSTNTGVGGLKVPRRKRSRVLGGLGVAVGCVRDIAISRGVSVAIAVCVAICVTICIAIGWRCSHLRVAAVVLLTVGCAIAHVYLHLGTFFEHLHLRFLGLMVLGALGGKEVDEETGNVEAVEVCNNPLEDSGNIPHMLLGANTKSDDQTDFDDDEEELDPKGDAQNRVLAVVDAQALIFPADEDGTDNVSANEDAQEDVVQGVVVLAVEDCEEN